jgi:hypothetical protein
MRCIVRRHPTTDRGLDTRGAPSRTFQGAESRRGIVGTGRSLRRWTRDRSHMNPGGDHARVAPPSLRIPARTASVRGRDPATIEKGAQVERAGCLRRGGRDREPGEADRGGGLSVSREPWVGRGRSTPSERTRTGSDRGGSRERSAIADPTSTLRVARSRRSNQCTDSPRGISSPLFRDPESAGKP